MTSSDSIPENLRPTSSYLLSEFSYSFKPPYWFISGLIFNLILAIGYGALFYLKGHHITHIGYIGAYFTSWIMADITTTNQLGNEPARAKYLRSQGLKGREILWLRNVVLVVCVGAIGILSTFFAEILTNESKDIIINLFISFIPILPWLAFGNLISVYLPYEQLRLRIRLKRRDTWVRWLSRAAIPYLMSSAIVPLSVWPLVAVGIVHKSKLSVEILKEMALVLVWTLLLGISISLYAYRKADEFALKFDETIWNV